MSRSQHGAMASTMPADASRTGALVSVTPTGAAADAFADGWSSWPGPDRMLGYGRERTVA